VVTICHRLNLLAQDGKMLEKMQKFGQVLFHPIIICLQLKWRKN